MRFTFRARYLLYILTLHALLAVLLFVELRQAEPLFGPKPVLLITLEILVVLSVYVAIRIYRTFRQPSDFIASGVEAIRDKDFTVKFVPTGNDEVDGLIQVYNLMIDQLRLERTRQTEQQLFLDKLIEASPIALLIFDYDERLSAINPKARHLLNRPEQTLIGKPLSAIDHPLTLQISRLPAGQSHTVRLTGVETYRVLRGQFMDQGFLRQFMFIEELTTELVETEKRAYGKVIRMMAHEVNNAIGAVNTIMNITESELPDSALRQAVRVAIDRNDRLSRFMARFADVVRLPMPQPVPTSLTDLLRNVSLLMQPQAEAGGIDLRLMVPDTVIMAVVDVVQLEQVLVNVIKNALEACSPGRCVELRLTTHELLIRNNGESISDDVASRLFDPFFSTKTAGQGIGLTLTRDILLNHGFRFSLRTEPDGWTTFRLTGF